MTLSQLGSKSPQNGGHMPPQDVWVRHRAALSGTNEFSIQSTKYSQLSKSGSSVKEKEIWIRIKVSTKGQIFRKIISESLPQKWNPWHFRWHLETLTTELWSPCCEQGHTDITFQFISWIRILAYLKLLCFMIHISARKVAVALMAWRANFSRFFLENLSEAPL